MSPNDETIVSASAAFLQSLNDEQLGHLKFVMPWQTDEIDTSVESDPDRFSKDGSLLKREFLQQACWNKFNENPQVSTAVKGKVGRLTGFGFEITSEIPKIQDILDEVELDQRNRLYTFWPKFVARSEIEGELFLCLTIHKSGFIEVDFIDPSNITGGGEDGVVYHPSKSTMPLYYYVSQENVNTGSTTSIVIPSIYVARYPELANKVTIPPDLLTASKTSDSKFRKIGGFNRFIVSWDRSFLTKRNVSHLRTILEWLNHYETLKKYEIDHKKSAGAYLWVCTMTDPKAFRTWLSLSDTERKQTGLMAKKTPGGTIILPPGMQLECINPSLPNISESDTDIFHMITSGLNEPEDVTSGQSKGTFASVKASRGPMSDRLLDEISYFEKFLRHDFYGGIFYLKTMITGFPAVFDQKEAVDFKDQEPVLKNVKKRPELLLEITFPTSDVTDVESKARAYLGVKHGSLFDTLGIPNKEIAKRLGFGNYRKLRLQHATEEERYPELAVAVDQEAISGQGNGTDDGGDKKGNQVNPDKKPILKKRKKTEEK